jgi:DNA-binding transcriptional ArsR family regulator
MSEPAATGPRRKGARGREDIREIRDPRAMRALAHPVRLALLEALAWHGPLTATQASGLVGESPSSCSFHLRSLAQHGFVEETGDGQGRQRPWRRIGRGMTTVPQDEGGRVAARELGDMFTERYLARLLEARGNVDRLTADWQEAQLDAESILWVTLEELQDLNDELLDLALKYRHRMDDPSQRPADARPVELLCFTYNADITAVAEPREELGEQTS